MNLRAISPRNLVVSLAATFAAKRERRRAAAAVGPRSAVALLFPSRRGSIGDEAMAVAAATQLRRKGCNRLALITYSDDEQWSDLFAFDEIHERPSGHPRSWMRFCRWLAQYDSLGVIGADVLDGFYSAERSRSHLQIADTASRLGLRTVLLGFSYRARPAQSAAQALKGCRSDIGILCRDPHSLARVRELGRRSVVQVADLAFMLEPVFTSRVAALGEWVKERQSGKGLVLGINCNRQALGHWNPEECTRLVTAYAEAIAVISTKYSNVSFVLIPHDNRGDYSDERLVTQIFAALSNESRSRTYLIGKVWSASEIKALASLLDAAVSGRMHFAIACLGSGIPVASFEYQDKFSGLYELFDLPGLCVPGELSNRADVLVGTLEKLYVSINELKTCVRARLPEIRRLSLQNIDYLLGAQL